MPVTVGDLRGAESDIWSGGVVAQGGFGKLPHHREPMPMDKDVAVEGIGSIGV